MKAVLLAAGLGTRLRPITDNLPKCLVNINHKPLMAYWLDVLTSAGIKQILVNTHYFSEKVSDFVRGSRWSNNVTLTYEDELLGTGGTLVSNYDWLKEEAFIVAHADNLTFFDVKAFVSLHINRPANIDITMMTFETDVPESCGVVEVNESNTVVGFYEKTKKPPSNLANAAVYIFEPSVVQNMIEMGQRFIDISTEVIPVYLGKIQTYHNSIYHRDIGTVESLQQAQKDLKENEYKEII